MFKFAGEGYAFLIFNIYDLPNRSSEFDDSRISDIPTARPMDGHEFYGTRFLMRLLWMRSKELRFDSYMSPGVCR